MLLLTVTLDLVDPDGFAGLGDLRGPGDEDNRMEHSRQAALDYDLHRLAGGVTGNRGALRANRSAGGRSPSDWWWFFVVLDHPRVEDRQGHELVPTFPVEAFHPSRGVGSTRR